MSRYVRGKKRVCSTGLNGSVNNNVQFHKKPWHTVTHVPDGLSCTDYHMKCTCPICGSHLIIANSWLINRRWQNPVPKLHAEITAH